MHVYGATKAQTGSILSLVAVGMIVGSPLLGFVSNRILKGRKPTLVLASSAMVALTALLAFFTAELPPAVIGLICFGFGVFASAVAVVGFASAREIFPGRIAGTCFGLLNLFPFAGGALLQPVLGSILESRGKVGQAFTVVGYREAFFVLFLSALTALAASLFVKETIGGTGVDSRGRA